MWTVRINKWNVCPRSLKSFDKSSLLDSKYLYKNGSRVYFTETASVLCGKVKMVIMVAV